MRKQILTGFLIGLCLTLCVLLSASKIDAATKTAQDVNYPIYIDNVI
ncbi:MAG: hypothetical protein MJ246_06405 [Clostridia bacterium]|nr:hypothetical protein [Clostridia bacterium]